MRTQSLPTPFDHRQSVRRRWNVAMAGSHYDEAAVRSLFPRLALEHNLIAYIETLERDLDRAQRALRARRTGNAKEPAA